MNTIWTLNRRSPELPTFKTQLTVNTLLFICIYSKVFRYKIMQKFKKRTNLIGRVTNEWGRRWNLRHRPCGQLDLPLITTAVEQRPCEQPSGFCHQFYLNCFKKLDIVWRQDAFYSFTPLPDGKQWQNFELVFGLITPPMAFFFLCFNDSAVITTDISARSLSFYSSFDLFSAVRLCSQDEANFMITLLCNTFYLRL